MIFHEAWYSLIVVKMPFNYISIYCCFIMCRTGAMIDWVQCDGCELWFHLKCVGLTPDQCSDDDEYHCPVCVRRASTPPAPTSTQPPSQPRSSQSSSAVKRKSSKRPDMLDPGTKPSKPGLAKTAAPTSPLPVPAKQTVAAPSSAVASKDTALPPQSVDSHPLRSVATGGAGGFAAFARPGNFGSGGTKLFEFSTLAQNAVRRPSSNCSASGGRDEPSSGKSLAGSATGSAFTFGQYLYTPWLAKSALAPRWGVPARPVRGRSRRKPGLVAEFKDIGQSTKFI